MAPEHIEPDPEISDTARDDHDRLDVRAVYAATTSHWTHAEQMRWTLLYNYLMASTILLLAWSTVFVGGSRDQAGRGFLLLVLSVAGIAISALWVSLGFRATRFVVAYHAFGLQLEQYGGSQGPFAIADDLRRNLRRAKGRDRLALPASSNRVVVLVPAIFVAVYAACLILSLA